ncbi:MAG: hypothetical protein ZNDK_0662 [Candidatus Desulfovibrio kirbyi]|uniref:Uncharacterized protein n=1 Tax=Candidatus Desulfovibrio kirbyi TaxID=2696086 RepID=A0A6L2R5N9_9BACT|nr:MAG: hypothetical protein ZNDK_0662 [Candidatus Desulfovibrio kirbyi]
MNTGANMQQPEISPTVEPSFRKPGTQDWESLQTPITTEGTEDKTAEDVHKVEQANENLKATLLQSLQMQHLIVLAGSGCSCYAGGPRMSDLWNMVVGKTPSDDAEKAASIVHYNLEDSNIEKFLSQVEAFLSFVSDSDVVIKKFLDDAQQKILHACSDFLTDDKLDSHKTLLHRLSRRRTRDQRLRIFTTNYDLCFERAAAHIGCVAIDGFSFTTPRRYDPRHFDYDIIRRPRSGDDNGNYLEGVFLLYKLHGSVNWEKTANGIVEKNPDPQKECLIYPANGKYQQSYNQPFIESISQYLTAIREPSTCLLVIGFGFKDDHLSEPILSAVRSNPHLRLIVVAPSLKESANGCQNLYMEKLVELSTKGFDVWFINELFENFVNRVPDLKSLTPAERLAKAISGVMQQ